MLELGHIHELKFRCESELSRVNSHGALMFSYSTGLKIYDVCQYIQVMPGVSKPSSSEAQIVVSCRWQHGLQIGLGPPTIGLTSPEFTKHGGAPSASQFPPKILHDEYDLYMWNAIKWLGNLTHSVVGPWQSILFQVSLQHIFLDYCSASLSRLKPPPAKSQASVPCSKASFNAPSSIFPSTPWYDLYGLDEGTWPWNRHVPQHNCHSMRGYAPILGV